MILEGIGRWDQSQTSMTADSIPPSRGQQTNHPVALRARTNSSNSSSIMTSHNNTAGSTDDMDFPCLEVSRCYLTEKEHGLRLGIVVHTIQDKSKASKEKRRFIMKQKFAQSFQEKKRSMSSLLTSLQKGLTTEVSSASSGSHDEHNNDVGLETSVPEDEILVDDTTTTVYELVMTPKRSVSEEWYVHLDSQMLQPSGKMVKALQLCHVMTGQYLCLDAVTGQVSTTSQPTTNFQSDIDATTWILERHVMTSPVMGMNALHSAAAECYHLLPKLQPTEQKDHDEKKDVEQQKQQQQQQQKQQQPLRLCYQPHNDYAISHSTNPSTLSFTRNVDFAAVWEMEFSSGELCFIRNPVMHTQLRCNPLGQLSLSSKSEGWEVFRFIEVYTASPPPMPFTDNHNNKDSSSTTSPTKSQQQQQQFPSHPRRHVVIGSWTHTNKFLSSDPDGQIRMTDNRLGHWERWELIRTADSHGVYIVSVAHPGRYLALSKQNHLHQSIPGARITANTPSTNSMLCTTTKPNDFATWHLDAAHSHLYFLSSPTSSSKQPQQVSTNKRGPFLTKNKRHWEEWRMEPTPEGYITLYNPVHDKYLGCNSTGDVHTTSSKGEWSEWELGEWPQSPSNNNSGGGIFLRSKAHHRNLAVRNNSTLCTTQHVLSDDEVWRLEPCLPRTISGPQIAALGAAGVMGVALTVAMPYAVVGAVEAAGLATTEVGLLFTAEAMAGFGGGAILGASLMGTTAAMVDKQAGGGKNSSRNMSPKVEASEEAYLKSSLRPICSWKNW